MTFREFREAAVELARARGLGTVICSISQSANEAEGDGVVTWDLTVFALGGRIVASAFRHSDPHACLAAVRAEYDKTHRDDVEAP